MQVRVISRLNRRLTPSTKNNALKYALLPNDTLQVVDQVDGESIADNKTWFKTDKGFYVWSGGVQREVPAALSWGLQKLNIGGIRDRFGETGDEARVALLDTGLRPGPEFNNSFVFKDFIGGSVDKIDEDHVLHGSSCAGIIAGSDPTYSVAPKADLLVGRVMKSKNFPDVAKLVEGLEWVLQRHMAGAPVDVVSLSIALDDNISTLSKAVADLVAANIIVVAGAGNYNGTYDFYPASYQGVLCIGAIDESLQKLPTSASSTHLQFLAPGFNVKTISNPSSADGFSGTSAATAFAAGCFALLCSFNKKKANPVSVQELVELTKKSAVDYGRLGFDMDSGHGIINPMNAIGKLNSI